MKSVLVVDDEKIIRRLIIIRLERYGFATDAAENGRQAVAKSGERLYALIIIDVYMPEMNGIDAVAAIRLRDLSSQRKRVTIIANSSDDSMSSKMLEAGADEFIQKTKLFEKIDEIVVDWPYWRTSGRQAAASQRQSGDH